MTGELHEAAANLMMLVAAVHLTGVVVSSRLHRENLIRSMLTGYKLARPADGTVRPYRATGAMLLAAVLAGWLARSWAGLS